MPGSRAWISNIGADPTQAWPRDGSRSLGPRCAVTPPGCAALALALALAVGRLRRPPPPARHARGRSLFVQACGFCHSLTGHESPSKQGGDLLGVRLRRAGRAAVRARDAGPPPAQPRPAGRDRRLHRLGPAPRLRLAGVLRRDLQGCAGTSPPTPASGDARAGQPAGDHDRVADRQHGGVREGLRAGDRRPGACPWPG